jgi:hypothetical protein
MNADRKNTEPSGDALATGVVFRVVTGSGFYPRSSAFICGQ